MIDYDILISGIGGQGVITLGTILKLAALEEGLEVFGSEARGGAQREGVVTSNVRYRKYDPADKIPMERRVCSSVIPKGSADLLISLEPLEALRHAVYLNSNSVVISNTFTLLPVHVRLGKADYPPMDEIIERLRRFTPNVYMFNIDELSLNNFDDLRHVNVICIGLAAALANLPISDDAILNVVKSELPGFEANKRGFELGKSEALA
jgi:indolepyruvate ferredoxin oxidoreductase beta subunit